MDKLFDSLFKREKHDDFFEFACEYIGGLEEQGRYSCYRAAKATARKLFNYNNRRPLPLNRITEEIIKDFETYLTEYCGNCRNTVVETMKTLSKMLDSAGMKNNPVKNLKYSRREVARTYLVKDEIDRIEMTPIRSGSLEKVAKEIFLVECYTGLRISDLLTLKWSDYDGRTICVRMKKTQRIVQVPVVEKVRIIMESYRNLFEKASRYVFPLIEVCAPGSGHFQEDRAIHSATVIVNHRLKKIAERAGLGKSVSSHVGRHSFATMLISKGANIYDVKELLGHSDVRVTQVYAHMTEARRRTVMDLLEKP